ncbi:unannotated protein [freshwater metagenome]|uniref:Unannotated protein n=1 Tax=freshwater metagenome TaxID=449393 RepID=A0A6J6BY89_9ZZZZ
MRTIARCVFPRTIESSTTTIRLPSMISRRGLSFKRIPSWRIVCEGWIKVLPTYEFLTRPIPKGMPEPLAYPIAAGVPDSGTGITKSASTGDSLASCSPIRTRVA